MKIHWFIFLLIAFTLSFSACGSPTSIPEDIATGVSEKGEGGELSDAMDTEATDPVAEMPESDLQRPPATDTTETEDTGEDMGSEVDDDTMDEDTEMEESMPILPDWYSVDLRDVNSGETFRITDYQGKVILVEAMAMWCSVCLQQQIHVRTLHERLGMEDDFVSIALDIDPNEDAGPLRNYTRNNGFDWHYAISPVEVSRELAQLYGNLFLNPPSAPILIIDKQGVAHPLPFGLKSLEKLQAAIEPFLNE